MFYPVYLNLKGRRVVVIGGGEVAQRKIDSLLGTGASVVVISPAVTNHVAAMAEQRRIEVRARTYVPGDCAGAALVFTATGNAEISRAVHEEATALGIFVNTADEPAFCTFIMPASCGEAISVLPFPRMVRARRLRRGFDARYRKSSAQSMHGLRSSFRDPARKFRAECRI